MGGPVDNMTNLSSLIISIATVLVTVGSAFWLREKQDKIDTLRAVVAEIEQNDIHAETVIHHLFQERNGFSHPGDNRDVSLFQTSAYDNIKNSGELSQLPENVRRSLHYHYTVISALNRRLEQRQDAQLITSSTNRKNTEVNIDRSVFDLVAEVSSPDRLQITASNLRNNSIIEYHLRGKYRLKSDQTQLPAGDPRQTFDGIKAFLIEEINNSNILGYF